MLKSSVPLAGAFDLRLIISREQGRQLANLDGREMGLEKATRVRTLGG